MAQIPQINNPITSKNYNYSPRQQDANTEPFDIVKLTGVGGAGVNSDSAAKSRLEMGNRELIPLRVAVAKDPTLAVEMLKDLLNVEVLNQALITGHTELYGSLESLAKEIYITPEQLVQEIVNQEQQNTMFSGHEFYDVLREVAQTTTDPGTKEIIGNLLKSINFAQNRDEILGALRANLKFLSEYYSPNEKLSEKLLNLSKEWGADDSEKYFDYLKGETLSILKDVSGSLLNDDKTQMLIPLITHNLSRYNNSPYMCKEYFNLLLTQISSGTLRESLKNSFNRLYSAIFDKNPMQDPNNTKTMEQVGSMPEEGRQVSTDNYTTNSSQNQPLSANSEDKNLNFVEENNEIQQNIKISDKNFVENADNSRPIFDSKGNFIGLQPKEPVFDKNGNQVGFKTQPFLFDDDGNQVKVFSDPILYDEYGNRVDLKNFPHDENGVPIFDRTALYDENGSPIDPKNIPHDENGVPIFDRTVLYDEYGSPVDPKNIPHDENGVPIFDRIVLYDEYGSPVDLNSFPHDENGVPIFDRTVLYDEYGSPIDLNNIPHDENGVPIFDRTVLYDEYGSPIDLNNIPHDENGVPIFDRTALYDEYESPVDPKNFSQGKNNVPFFNRTVLYDEYGSPVDLKSILHYEDGIPIFDRAVLYDEDGNPVNLKNIPRDEDGIPIFDRPMLYDEYGNPVDLNNMLYDEDGAPIYDQTALYDKDGNPVSVRQDMSDRVREEAVPPQEITGWHKTLNEMMSDRGYMQELKSSGFNIEHIMSAYTRGRMSGTDALKTIIEGLFVRNSESAENINIDAQLNLMAQDFSKVNTMQELIDNLNSLLRDMPDIPLRERLYGVFVDIIDKMAVKSELPQHGVRPPVSSTLDNLTEFIENNINNPALKSLDSFNAANLLQSLLNAPGVFTPLAHYILPLQVDDTRAFGELWVDNDENNPNNTPGTQRNYHLFLTFDVESIGRFEVDMYALGDEVNLSLLYPPRFEKEIEPMKDRVTKIIRNSGYQARTFETAPLKKPHNLVEVFPKITDKRTSLNKRI